MDFLLLLTVILVFGAQTLFFKMFSRKYMKNMASYFAYGGLYYCIVVIILSAFGINLAGIHTQTLMLAVPFGLVFVTTIYLYMKAMENGPLSLSSLIYSFGLLVPIAFGALFWNEAVSLLQGAALLLLFFTFYLGGDSPQNAGQKVNFKWLAFCIAALIGNGALMTLVKAHQMLLPGYEIKEFLVLAFGTASLISLLLFLRQRFLLHEKITHLKNKAFVLLVLGTGITTAVGNQISLILSGRLSAVVQFPVMNGGIVFFSSLLSMLLFKEKLTRRAWIGLALGLAAIVLISLK